MAKKIAKKAVSKKATAKASAVATAPKRGRVAGREYDPTPVEFESGSLEELQLHTRVRESSKYKQLIEAAIALEDGECIVVKVQDGEDPQKKRLNISQAIAIKAKPQLEEGYKLRVRLNADDSLVVVSCHHVGTEETAEEE